MRTKDSEYEQLDKPRWLLSVLDGFSEFIMKENSKKKTSGISGFISVKENAHKTNLEVIHAASE
jgi:hypothetical protein